MERLKKQSSVEFELIVLMAFLTFILVMSVDTSAQSMVSNKVSSQPHNEHQESYSLASLLSTGVSDPQRFLKIGQTYVEEKPDLAEEFFRHVLLIAPELPEVYTQLYYIKTLFGSHDSAAYFAQKAVEINPTSAQAYLDFSSALFKCDKIE